jgi:hypothetical protein
MYIPASHTRQALFSHFPHLQWEFINSVTIQLAKFVFQNFRGEEKKMKYDILNK